MPAGQHPFIDVAVHRQVRSRFAAGEGLVLFAADLGSVLWANGRGASLFGFATPYELMDEWHTAPATVRRQLDAAASRLSGGEGEKTVSLRVAAGLRSRTVSVTLIGLALHDGTHALLLADGSPAGNMDVQVRAERIISGLGDTGTHVAVVDAAGQYLAASPGISALDIGLQMRRDLVDHVAEGENRLVKRMLAAGGAAAALARLSDKPALHLLFVVETGQEPQRHDDDAAAAPAGSGRAKASAAPPPVPAVNAWSLAPGGIRRTPSTAAGEASPAAAEGEPGSARDAADGAQGQPEPESSPAEEAARTPGFVFDAAAKPVRFVWRIDPQGRFSDLSPDFAAAVGPNAADIIDRRFSDVAKVFGFDRDNQISDLLRRRDTWSGKTVSWPVQGTSLSVPVDLAALPIYSRTREFEGFRGFGIVRVGDAHEDPEAIGLSLTDVPHELHGADAQAPADATPGRQEGVPDLLPDVPEEIKAESSPAAEESTETPVADGDDPFRGETPALRIVRPFGRRQNDKVIDLDQRRSRTREVLSNGEQQAFREIGERLAKSFGKDAGGEGTGKPTGQESQADRVAQAEPEPAKETPAAGPPEEAKPAERSPAAPAEEEPVAAESPGGWQDGQARATTPIPSAFATIGAASAPARLSPDIIDDLPVALLLHDGHDVHHANAEFFGLTGYADLAALVEAGGLANLFAAQDIGEGMSAGALPGTLQLVRADGGEVPVHARLQSVQWNDKRALMLSLMPAQSSGMDDAAAMPPQGGDDSRSDGGPAAGDAARVAALKIEVEELRSILETATDGVVILGEQGDIRSMNRSASALFDYDESEIRSQPFAKLFAHESQRAVMDYLNGLSEHGVASVLNDGREVIGREASGGFLPLFMTIGRLTGSNGYCAVMRDITQWKRTEEELRAAKFAAEQANSHKSEFLARVSHEIRTPLNAIIGFSDMMAEQRFGPIGSPRYLEYAHDIGRSGKHVLDIVNDLLDISKIEAGEMDISFAAVALNDTIAEAVSLLQPQANSQRVIIRTSLSSSVPEIVADQRSIKQIALNLLSNAIRFTPAGGQIVVSTAYETNGSVVLRIRDTGVGMSQGELEQAMKPFRQIRGSSRPRGDGTGLGLPLTKAMVEANRAQFEIRSAPNEGTLIEIGFPPQRVLAD